MGVALGIVRILLSFFLGAEFFIGLVGLILLALPVVGPLKALILTVLFVVMIILDLGLIVMAIAARWINTNPGGAFAPLMTERQSRDSAFWAGFGIVMMLFAVLLTNVPMGIHVIVLGIVLGLMIIVSLIAVGIAASRNR